MADKEAISIFFRVFPRGGKSRVTDDAVGWLIKNGYFDAPASMSTHMNCRGGLFQHSFNVCNTLLVFTKDLNLAWQDKESPMIIGMFHDLCKIDQYRKGKSGYEYVTTTLHGNGEESILLLSTLMRLTEEEMYCIRFHMGAFSDSKKERTAYLDAVKKYPNVLFTHTADIYAGNVLEINNDSKSDVNTQ